MKKIAIILSLVCSKLILCQNFQYVNYGKAIPEKGKVCLVIKNGSKSLKQPINFSNYKLVEQIKLIGFNESSFSIDSILTELINLPKIEKISFDNCDLTSLETSFEKLTTLKTVEFINKTSLYENTLYPLLKNNQIEKINIQANDTEINTDSLYLLSNLKSLNVSSTTYFDKPNKTVQMNLASNSKKNINYDISYSGSLYKNEIKQSIINPVKVNPVSYSALSNLDCIKQPLPGVKINDTIYTINSENKNSFNYKSGSQISIDKNAFETLDGKLYNGNVTVFYREFRNPVEIMLSGIPMTNKIDGETQLFKSGGMYQITAFSDVNKPLQTKSDSSIKIKFAMTDTSNSFQFFSLNNNGSWATKTNSINSVPTIVKSNNSFITNNTKATEAVRAYFGFLLNPPKKSSDSLFFNDRFNDMNYLYTYRKDNLKHFNKAGQTNDSSFIKTFKYHKKNRKAMAFFKVKYAGRTKDKQIIYKIVPVNKYNTVPQHISCLFNNTYLYSGNFSKEEFKKKFNRKLFCWDVRTTGSGSNIEFQIKTTKKMETLSGELITLHNDKTYTTRKRGGKILNLKVQRAVKTQERKFNKNGRLHIGNYNEVNYALTHNIAYEAYKVSQKKQNSKEKAMTYNEFVKYANKYRSQFMFNIYQDTSVVAMALLSSGLGVKNIDSYLHSGCMEDILVNFENKSDSSQTESATMLYTSINTSYPLLSSGDVYKGHYFIKRDNYIIRFNKGMMQVTKPDELKGLLNNGKANIAVINQFDVSKLNSNEITRLILN